MNWFVPFMLTGLSVAALSIRLNRQLLAPSLVFVATWWVPAAASLLTLSALQQPYSTQGLLIVLLVTLLITTLLLAGETIAGATTRMHDATTDLRHHLRSVRWNSPPVAGLILLASLAVTVGIILVEFRPAGIPLLGASPEALASLADNKLHRIGKDSRWQLLLSADAALGCLAFAAIFVVREPRYRMLYACLVVLPLLTGVLKLSKYDVLQPLVFYGVLGYFLTWRWWRSWRPLAVGCLCLLLLGGFAAMTNHRWQLSGGQGTYRQLIAMEPLTGVVAIDEAAAFYYGYAALNFANFDRALAAEPANHPGLSLFRPLFTLTLQAGRLDPIAAEIDTRAVSGASAVGTFMRDLYLEADIPAVFAGALVYAAIVASVYIWMRRRMTLYRVLVYAGVLWPLLWLFFQNNFSNLDIYVGVAAACSVLYLARQVPPPAQRPAASPSGGAA